jgi:hypothetical protein
MTTAGAFPTFFLHPQHRLLHGRPGDLFTHIRGTLQPITHAFQNGQRQQRVVQQKQYKVFAKPTAIFAGYGVSADGFRLNPELTRAIRKFPRPEKITDLRSFYGLCQQVGNLSDKIAAALTPLSRSEPPNIPSSRRITVKRPRIYFEATKRIRYVARRASWFQIPSTTRNKICHDRTGIAGGILGHETKSSIPRRVSKF